VNSLFLEEDVDIGVTSSPLKKPVKGRDHWIELLKLENTNLKIENESLRTELLEKSLECNKTKSDKFILFHELSELFQRLNSVDLEKLNTFYKSITNNISKFDMPSAQGIKYNLMSAQAMISKILKTDSYVQHIQPNQSRTKYEKDFPKKEEEWKKETDIANNIYQSNTKFQMRVYYNILNKTEEEFDNPLDRKLSKKSKWFFTFNK
jgi:hypothetical protein